MRVYGPNTIKGRRVGRDDVNHRTCDNGNGFRKASARKNRVGARQEAKKECEDVE